MAVTSKLYGRLGNQLFQAAAAYSYSLRFDMEFFLPAATQAPRVFEHYLKELPVKFSPTLPPGYNVYKELAHEFHELPYRPNVILDGYFQSEKYFADFAPQVKTLFRNIIPYKRLAGFVGIHVRLGDYISYSTKHPPITYEYLKAAVLHYNEQGYRSFVVTSDDIGWCKQHLTALELYGNTFSYSHANTPIADLAMLSCCDHQIISNSTFSWWAHWMNDYDSKTCIAPKVWFGKDNAHLSTKDIYLPNMIQL